MADLFEELTNPFTGLPGADRAALVEIVARVRSARRVCDQFEGEHAAGSPERAFARSGVLEHVLAAVPEWML